MTQAQNTITTQTFTPATGISHEIRVVPIDGEPWFVAADVCRALDMDVTSGTAQWLRPLADSERRRVYRRDLPDLFSGTAAPSATIVNESGLYKLLMRSNKPEARTFQTWAANVLDCPRLTRGARKVARSNVSFLQGGFPTERRLAHVSDTGASGWGGMRSNVQANVVNEAGLYKLVMRSELAWAAWRGLPGTR